MLGLFNNAQTMETTELEDAAVYPLVKTSSPRKVKGGLHAPGLPKKFGQLREGRLPVPAPLLGDASDHAYLKKQPRPSKLLKGHHLYAGPFFRHYGHFMAESVHRLWAYGLTPEKYDSVLVCAQPLKGTKHAKKLGSLPPYVAAVTAYFGIPEEKVRLVHKPVRAERLTVPTQASTFGDTPAPTAEYLSFLDRRADAMLGDTAGLPSRIYVSRTNYLHKGSFAGERYFESLLAAEGFHIVKPETLPLLEQLRHYRAADLIIFSEGSAVHTAELLGSLTADVVLVQRRQIALDVMRSVLEPRARTFRNFDRTVTMPSIVSAPDGHPGGGSALSLIDAPALVAFLRGGGIAELSGFALDEFYKQEAADVARHLLNASLRNSIDHGNLGDRFAKFKYAMKKHHNPWLKEII